MIFDDRCLSALNTWLCSLAGVVVGLASNYKSANPDRATATTKKDMKPSELLVLASRISTQADITLHGFYLFK